MNALDQRLLAFIMERNETAHPSEWTARSFEKVLAKVEAALAHAA